MRWSVHSAVAALITPPDIVSMILLAIPMCLLYELGLLAVRWLLPHDRVRATT